MYKNQLQELAQRSCFNLPFYACIREGPDHAPRFKATVNFNGEVFGSPAFCTTLRQAEHAAAEVALSTLSKRGPSRSLAARVLDETGVYKNLLQETTHRAGLNLPVYTTVRSGRGHMSVFSCTVELAGMSFTGDPAETKKQAQKNAAMAAWSALKQLPHLGSSSSSSVSSSSLLEPESNEEQEQVIIARALAKFHPSDGNTPSPQNGRMQHGRRKLVPIPRDANPPSGVSIYSIPYQGWAYSNFLPELAMHQMWQQEQVVSQQQSHLLTLPAPPSPNDPRMLPFIQSMIQPNQTQYFPVMEQEELMGGFPCFTESGPGSLYFPGYPSPVLPASRSQVTIQEINEEKNEAEDEEWYGSGISGSGGVPNGRKVNLRSDAMVFPQFEVSNSLPVDSSAMPKFQESHNRGANVGHPGFNPVACSTHLSVAHDSACAKDIREIQQVEGSRRERFEWVRGVSNRPMPPSPSVFESTQTAAILHHPPTTSSLGPPQMFRYPLMAASVTGRTAVPLYPADLRPRMPHFAAPVTIRTAVPVCSARPRVVNLNSGVSSVNSMAPAVHIRSVTPVCSAPPPVRSTQDSGQARSRREPEGISMVSSDSGKLRI